MLGSVLPLGKLEEHQLNWITSQLSIDRDETMTASKHHIVFIVAVLEIFEFLVATTIIDDTFKDELILSQSSCLIESHNVYSSS